MEEKHAKLPLKEKLSWGLAGFSEQLAVNGLNNLFVPIYNIGLGLDSVLVGWAISIPRFFDMISDPVMGNLSDNCRSRFGRRRPFILWGSILMALAMGLAYMGSPDWSSGVLFVFATLTCILFYLMYTVFQVPYTALGLELTADYDERADIQKYRMIFASVGTFTIPWLYKICISTGQYAQSIIARDQIVWYQVPFKWVAGLANEGVKSEVLGVRYIAWIVAALIILTALPAFFYTKEKAISLKQEKIQLLKSTKLVAKNRTFRVLCGMIFLVITGMYFVVPLLTYINIFYVFQGDKAMAATWTGWNGTVLGISSLVGSFIIPQLVKKFGKKKVLIGGLCLAAASVFSTWFMITPSRPALQLLPAVLIGFGMMACWLLNGAFAADICDEDELVYGFRREGIFSAVFGFVIKLSFTAIALLLGYLLKFIGYSAGAETMSPEAILRLRLFLALFPATCMLLAALVFSRYPLTRGRVMEIQEQLRERKLNQETTV